MIPRPHQALMALAGRIGARIVPELNDTYAVADATIVTLLLSMLARELDSGVERRMQDGAALKSLFAAADQAPGTDARARFAASEPAALTLAEVDRWLDEGLTLLIELHAWAEQHDAGLDEAVWRWLADHTERHRFD